MAGAERIARWVVASLCHVRYRAITLLGTGRLAGQPQHACRSPGVPHRWGRLPGRYRTRPIATSSRCTRFLILVSRPLPENPDLWDLNLDDIDNLEAQGNGHQMTTRSRTPQRPSLRPPVRPQEPQPPNSYQHQHQHQHQQSAPHTGNTTHQGNDSKMTTSSNNIWIFKPFTILKSKISHTTIYKCVFMVVQYGVIFMSLLKWIITNKYTFFFLSFFFFYYNFFY